MFGTLWEVTRPRTNLAGQAHRNHARHRQLVCEPLEDRRLLSVAPQMLGDLTPGLDSTSPADFTQVGDTVFFHNEGGGMLWGNTDLWKTDGTPDGTAKVATVTHPNHSGGEDTALGGLVDVDGTLAFFVQDRLGDAGRAQLWKSNGTEAGTVLVHDFGVGSEVDIWDPNTTYAAVGDRLFAAVRTGSGTPDATGYELWVSDLEGAPYMVARINETEYGANPSQFLAFDGKLYFSADDQDGYELWVSDGTEGGTYMVKDIHDGSGSNPMGLTAAGDVFFFSTYNAYAPNSTVQLWQSDGTSDGTTLVHDFGPDASPAYSMYVPNHELAWVAETGKLFGVVQVDDNGTRSDALFVHDTNSGDTGLVKNMNPGGNDRVMNLSPGDGGRVAFAASDGAGGLQPWVTDGTAAGTHMIKDISIYWATWTPAAPFLNGAWYFPADDGIHGRELWTSDGTEDGTVLVADIEPDEDDDSSPQHLAAASGKLFFSAYTYGYGREPWVLDLAGEVPDPAPSHIGVWRNGWFSLDYNGNGRWDAGVDQSFLFGSSDHTPIIGDWNGDGIDQIGVWRNGWFSLNDNGEVRSFRFGSSDHTPIIGDWNGDGVSQIGVWRNGWFSLDYNGNGRWDAGVDQSFRFGSSDHTPIIGDWNGDGVDQIGVWRKGWFNLNDNGEVRSFRFGSSDHTPIIGAWSLAGGQPLHAAGLPANTAMAGPALDQAALEPIVVAAMADWDALLGLSAAQLDRLQRVEFVIADLPGTMLGMTRQDTIYLDAYAAGFGWFIDPTPGLDEEFAPAGSSGALQAVDFSMAGRMDLLTVVSHELGHVLGLADLDPLAESLMGSTLQPGQRYRPGTAEREAYFAAWG